MQLIIQAVEAAIRRHLTNQLAAIASSPVADTISSAEKSSKVSTG